MESGMAVPDSIVVETDSHTTTLGALGLFGTGVGATDMATILISGSLWFKVPPVLKIVLSGKPRSGVMAKDMILSVLGRLKQDAALYKGVEFCGETVDEMPMDERMACATWPWRWAQKRPTSPRMRSPMHI